ncbi:hypothetical protein DNTS_028531 [Danionella cerebrum]|uniref:Uncharacterized protein n=1 Tax=Danionella cerebrum TaxID=2873325 RepID=A0A553QIF5_9TELE|nr:hypothetical protein DNTS_028531 [Danionella translucida]
MKKVDMTGEVHNLSSRLWFIVWNLTPKPTGKQKVVHLSTSWLMMPDKKSTITILDTQTLTTTSQSWSHTTGSVDVRMEGLLLFEQPVLVIVCLSVSVFCGVADSPESLVYQEVFEAHAGGHHHYTLALLLSPFSYTTAVVIKAHAMNLQRPST